MRKQKRQSYSSLFKGKVALDALKEANTVAEIAHKHSVHTTLVSKWKKQAMVGMTGLFVDGRANGTDPVLKRSDERLVRELYEQVGRLKVENEWLKKKLG